MPTDDLSEEFLIWQCHCRGNHVASGLTVVSVITALKNDGQPLESAWPYSLTPPPLATYGPPNTVQGATMYHPASIAPIPLPSSDAVRGSLDMGGPVILGLRMWESFLLASDGRIPMPNLKAEQLLGTHAVLAVGYGYEANRLRFLFRNSWGSDWGNRGHGLLPAEYLGAYCIGAWVVQC